MTTVDHLRQAVTQPAATVSIAGVPWPAYKVVALLLGLIVAVLVAALTTAAAPAATAEDARLQGWIAGYRRRRRVTTTVADPANQKMPDLLKRDFSATAPNAKYVGDITYLPLEPRPALH